MTSLSSNSFARACRTFLALAYAEGMVPENRRPFLSVAAEEPLTPLLVPPVCEPLRGLDGDPNALRGYAFRLGCTWFPHVKLQVQWCEAASDWLFAVDTHDAIRLAAGDPDHARVRQLQDHNRALKEQIERAWEAEGLLTFNALLRRGLPPRTTI